MKFGDKRPKTQARFDDAHVPVMRHHKEGVRKTMKHHHTQSHPMWHRTVKGFLILVLGFCFAKTACGEAPPFKIRVHDPALPNIAIVTTGGTIAEKTDSRTGTSVPALDGEKLLESIPRAQRGGQYRCARFHEYRQFPHDSGHLA